MFNATEKQVLNSKLIQYAPALLKTNYVVPPHKKAPLPLAQALNTNTQPKDLEDIKRHHAFIRGMINGVSYMVSAAAAVTLLLSSVTESLKTLGTSTTVDSSFFEEHPEAFVSLAVVCSLIIVMQGLYTAYKYSNTKIENEDSEKLLRDRRTALDGAMSIAGISYLIAYNIAKAATGDPLGIIPCIVAGTVAIFVGISVFFINDKLRDYFTSKEMVKEKTSAATRLLLARLWGIVNALSYAGNVLMIFTIALVATKSIIAFAASATIISTLPLQSIGLVVGLSLGLIVMGIFCYRGMQIYGDIENKKHIYEENLKTLKEFENKGDLTSAAYEKALKTCNETKTQFELAKNVEKKFREHRLVIGAALTTFTMISSIGFGLAALSAPIPPLAIAIVILTLTVATISAGYVTVQGIKAYEEPKASIAVENTSTIVKATNSMFSLFREVQKSDISKAAPPPSYKSSDHAPSAPAISYIASPA